MCQSGTTGGDSVNDDTVEQNLAIVKYVPRSEHIAGECESVRSSLSCAADVDMVDEDEDSISIPEDEISLTDLAWFVHTGMACVPTSQ